MKIKFESGLPYQQEAINAIADIFKGQEVCTSNFTVFSPQYLAKQKTMDFNQIGYANKLQLTEAHILENTQKIQLRNGLKPSLPAELDIKHLDFSIEMETGTGKTYVYLRVRLLFDPPATSYLMTSMKEQIQELEWRLNVQREGVSWTDSNPVLGP